MKTYFGGPFTVLLIGYSLYADSMHNPPSDFYDECVLFQINGGAIRKYQTGMWDDLSYAVNKSNQIFIGTILSDSADAKRKNFGQR